MACFLYIAWSSDLQFHVTYYSGVSLIVHRNYNRLDQIVVPKSRGFHELLIKKLYVTPLAVHLGVQKLTNVLF